MAVRAIWSARDNMFVAEHNARIGKSSCLEDKVWAIDSDSADDAVWLCSRDNKYCNKILHAEHTEPNWFFPTETTAIILISKSQKITTYKEKNFFYNILRIKNIILAINHILTFEINQNPSDKNTN